MIEYIKIKNFGPIAEPVDLKFESGDPAGSPAYEVEMPDKKRLLKLMYIYGPNASGKTTVLKAIHFLRNLWLSPLNNKDELLDFDPFLFRDNPANYPSEIEAAFYANGIRYIYKVVFTQQAIHTEKLFFYLTNQPSEIFDRSTELDKRVSHVQFGSKVTANAKALNALETATLHNNSVLGAFLRTNVDIPEIEGLSRWARNFFPLMIDADTRLSEFAAMRITQDPKFKEWINVFLNKADKNIRSVDVQINRPETSEQNLDRVFGQRPPQDRLFYDIINYGQVSFLHDTGDNQVYQLPLKKESRGSQRFFGLGGVLYILLTNPGFVSIDELDTSLHPDLMKYFLQLFLLNSSGSQLLFTTHNLNLLAESDFVRRDALWFTEKEDDGAVTLFSAADFDSGTLRKDASLINAYKSGKLGAKPNLGSPYFTK
jgi:AAA15 family ATPase/GTPase